MNVGRWYTYIKWWLAKVTRQFNWGTKHYFFFGFWVYIHVLLRTLSVDSLLCNSEPLAYQRWGEKCLSWTTVYCVMRMAYREVLCLFTYLIIPPVFVDNFKHIDLVVCKFLTYCDWMAYKHKRNNGVQWNRMWRRGEYSAWRTSPHLMEQDAVFLLSFTVYKRGNTEGGLFFYYSY